MPLAAVRPSRPGRRPSGPPDDRMRRQRRRPVPGVGGDRAVIRQRRVPVGQLPAAGPPGLLRPRDAQFLRCTSHRVPLRPVTPELAVSAMATRSKSAAATSGR